MQDVVMFDTCHYLFKGQQGTLWQVESLPRYHFKILIQTIN